MSVTDPSSSVSAGMEDMSEAMRRALVRTSPGLSRFNPLPRILYHDPFEDSLGGWTSHIGNYAGSLRGLAEPNAGLQMDHRPPMLSTLSMWDTGSVGAVDGGYAMKIATRPRKGHIAKPNKRITLGGKGLLQLECWFVFKAEASRADLSSGSLDLYHDRGHVADMDEPQSADTAVRNFGFSLDLQDETHRWWPAIRYVNAEHGKLVEKWQWHAAGVRHPYLDGWVDIEDGQQTLCYNEIPTKHNWHYLRFLMDVESREYVELQCNARTFDLHGKKWRYGTIHEDEAHYYNVVEGENPLLPRCTGLLNCGPFIETGEDRRCFFYMDAFVLSASW